MKIVVTTFLSLDGVMESPDQWSGQFWRDDEAKFKVDELMSSDALLLGRTTYEEFASAWPNMSDDNGFANLMNNISKYVVSSTLKQTTWQNSHIINGDIVAEITKLRLRPGRDVLVEGSADLVNFLTQQHLVDEYRLMVHPVVVGKGKHLFKAGTTLDSLRLANTKIFDSGVLVLSYRAVK